MGALLPKVHCVYRGSTYDFTLFINMFQSHNPGVNTNTAASQNIPSSAVSSQQQQQQQQTTNAAGQPVEFNHAINYVNKIKVNLKFRQFLQTKPKTASWAFAFNNNKLFNTFK